MIWLEGMEKKEIILKDASFKEVVKYVQKLPEEEQEAAFLAAMFMRGEKR